MATVKVLHALLRNSRRTTIEHAVCFARHSYGNEVEFANIFGPQHDNPYDVLIVTYDLLALRNTPYWKPLRKIIIKQASLCGKTIFFPQDDYSSCAVLDDLFISIPNCVIYSPIVNDLHILYPKSRKQGIRFHEALTGYVDNNLEDIAKKYSRTFASRSIDVGQRVRYLPPQFGKEAQTKGKIAVEFADLARTAGFSCDVSTDATQVLLGERWHQFLGDIRFTVGGLGGASLADPHGKLADQIRRRTFRNPDLSMDELNSGFRSRRGRHGDFGAISPRIFEAAALGVCQILFEANYVGRLRPWQHYIPLRPDLTNAEEVLNFMTDKDECSAIAQRCKEELISSGDFTYDKFVRDFWIRETGALGESSQYLSFSDSIGRLLPLFSKGLEHQELCADQVRLKFLETKNMARYKFSESNSELDFAIEEIEAIHDWLQQLKDREIPLESLLINWSPVLGSGWLEDSLERM
jgi:hypothetical protein